MDYAFLLKGLIMGFSIAAPVGPIGVLCIRRTLAEGRLVGLLTGLGAATADAIYGCVAGFGLVLISSILVSQQMFLRLCGGLFLCYLGTKTFLARPEEHFTLEKRHALVEAYISALFLTLTNPMTVISFAAIFAGLGVASGGGDYSSAGLLVLGVFAGSTFWWATLSSAVSLFRRNLTHNLLQWVNRISGSIIAGFGVLALLSLAL